MFGNFCNDLLHNSLKRFSLYGFVSNNGRPSERKDSYTTNISNRGQPGLYKILGGLILAIKIIQPI